MRIINRCKADFDKRFAKTVNAATGNRIETVVIRRPHFKKDRFVSAYYEPGKDSRKMRITILARPTETREDMRRDFAHEIAEMLLSLQDKEMVCDGYARNLVREYGDK
jgi:hypothetical protein